MFARLMTPVEQPSIKEVWREVLIEMRILLVALIWPETILIVFVRSAIRGRLDKFDVDDWHQFATCVFGISSHVFLAVALTSGINPYIGAWAGAYYLGICAYIIDFEEIIACT